MDTTQIHAPFGVTGQLSSANNYAAIIERMIAKIGQETDRKKVLAAILPYALAISQVELGALLIASDDPDNLSAVARRGMPDEVVRQLTVGDLGRLLLMGRKLWVKPRPMQLNAQQALLGRHKLAYLFGVPFRFDGQVLGAIVVGSHKADAKMIDREQQQWLSMLAQLTALFLDNVRLRTTNTYLVYRQEQGQNGETPLPPPPEATTPQQPMDVEELEQLLAAVMSAEEEVANQNVDLGLLNALSNELGSTLHLDAILDAVLKRTLSILNAETGWCYLLDEQNDFLTLRGHQGLSEQYVNGMQHLSPGDGVEGMAFTRSEPILRDGMLFHSGKARVLVQEEGLRTVAAVPLRTDNKTYGVLAVANRHDWVWSSRDKRMLVSIGRQVAHAVANSQMYSEVQEKAQNWESSYSALQQANLELTRRAEALERQIQELHQAEQQIWVALAASQRAAHHSPEAQADEELMATLKRILAAMSKQKQEKQQMLSRVA
ncbi:MAG: GAF domain-containing protein [Anaerolineae bacterium]|nr:GAF domain-containing protein [Anaerolineae bacterium]